MPDSVLESMPEPINAGTNKMSCGLLLWSGAVKFLDADRKSI